MALTCKVNALWTQRWDQVRPVGIHNMGKEGGRREVSGVGIGTGGIKNAVWSVDMIV